MDNHEQQLILELKKDLPVEPADKISLGEIRKKLAIHVNDLINHDFEKLVSLLYRIDVNEAKLKHLLQENKNKDAGDLIAQMIIERQLQKIKTRNEFSKKKDESDEEKW
jgi:hypothetical protein